MIPIPEETDKLQRMVALKFPVPEELFVEPKMRGQIVEKDQERDVYRADFDRILLLDS